MKAKWYVVCTHQSAITEAPTVFSRLPSLMAADNQCPLLRLSLRQYTQRIHQSSCRQFIMHEFLGHSMNNGFIFKKIKERREKETSYAPFRIYHLISTANPTLFEWNWAGLAVLYHNSTHTIGYAKYLAK